MSRSSILLVEDDHNLGFVIRDHLEREGYEVVHAVDGEAGWKVFCSQRADLCLIDIMMPRMDGFSLAGRIRERDALVPILFLTARSMEEDRLKGFEIGGDDYIIKPFSINELSYRIRVFLRRKILPPAAASIEMIGTLEFDINNLLIRNKETAEESQLTRMEADLLSMLIARKNKLIRREEILEQIWGENDYFKGRSLDVFISRLRKYLKADATLEIRNHHGVGFTLIDHDFTG